MSYCSWPILPTLGHSSLGQVGEGSKLTTDRNLFPHMCFGQRNYAAAPHGVHCSYKSFTDDNLPCTASPAVMQRSKELGHQPLMVLLRGKTAPVDKLLEWLVSPRAANEIAVTHHLQDGIFDALHKSVLAAVQFSIIADAANPSNVIESYTFSFKYTDNVHVVGRRLEGIIVTSPDGKQVTVQHARAGLWSIVRQCLVVNNFLPSLPGEFVMPVNASRRAYRCYI